MAKFDPRPVQACDSAAAPPAKVHDPAPVRPDEPDPADCCGEGCVRCIYDVYDEAMERYEAALAAWKARQSAGKKDHPGTG